MKKIWTLIASTMLVASVAFAQDDYDYADQSEEQYTEQEQAEIQAEDQASDASEEEQPSVAEEPAPSQPVAAPISSQANVQEPEPANTEEDNSAQEPAPRQVNRFGFGLRVAFDYGRMFGFKEDMDNDSDISGSPSGIGFEAGLMVRFQMIPNLFFAPEVNVAYISTNHEYMGSERKYNSVDLEIPLLMRGIVADRFYVTGGPQVVFSMSSKAEIEPLKVTSVGITKESEEKIDQASFGFGIAAGAGFNIYEGLFIDLRYYMGLTELYPDVKSMDDFNDGDVAEGDFYMINMSGARMMKFKVGISYWFK
ncbi:MAG: outer membrane beta-barrel protein [Fibrobacter sp.]|jgi:opacity protein-like surface antigen|nr:outer membrane beta-barrel protein [Fibrobacter sp.]